ncbi:MAG: recombinase family protein [Armatimonas sp.]
MTTDFDWETDEREVARVAMRVSKVRGKDEDCQYSTKLQLDEGLNYCTSKRFSLDEVASLADADEDVSGFRKSWRERPGLMRHYEAAKRREFQHLVVYKLSRLGRNIKDSLDLIDAFEKEGVTIHAVKEKIDASDASGRFIRNVLLAAAEMQSEDTSQFIQGAILQRAKAGKVQHGAPPIWIMRNTEGIYETIPEQVAAIRRMVELRLAGTGYVKIARTLNEEGYRTINGKHFTDGMAHKYLSPSWIDTMQGTGFLNRHGESGTRKQPRIGRTVIPNLFPAILTEEEATTLRVIQDRYSNLPKTSHIQGAGDWMTNRRKRKGGRYSATTQYLLSSIVYCACCGERLYSGTQSEDYRASKHKYLCIRARTNGEAHVDGGVSISGWSLEDAVLRLVRQILQEPPPPRAKKPVGKLPFTDFKKVREELTRRCDFLLDQHERQKISQEDFDRRYAQVQAEREALDAREAEQTAPAARDTALKLLGEVSTTDTTNNGETQISREQLRQLILLTVKRVETPVVFEGRYVRGRGTGLRRYARVTLHFDTKDGHREFLVPIYQARFNGIKEKPEPAEAFAGLSIVRGGPKSKSDRG